MCDRALSVTDQECVRFLQSALPRLGLRWPGFRKVRRTVCKRLGRRLATLGLPDLDAYRQWLDTHPEEWTALDGLCTISLSHFYRDVAVWEFMTATLLPQLEQRAAASGTRIVRAWCAGCASGEEPYTLALVWRLRQPALPATALEVIGTDVDTEVLARARRACYPPGSLKLLPRDWIARAFLARGAELCLDAGYRAGVEFMRQDVRREVPDGPFDLILCRNLVFTYFAEPVQRATLRQMLRVLRTGGALVIGRREALPADEAELEAWPGAPGLGIFRRRAA